MEQKKFVLADALREAGIPVRTNNAQAELLPAPASEVTSSIGHEMAALEENAVSLSLKPVLATSPSSDISEDTEGSSSSTSESVRAFAAEFSAVPSTSTTPAAKPISTATISPIPAIASTSKAEPFPSTSKAFPVAPAVAPEPGLATSEPVIVSRAEMVVLQEVRRKGRELLYDVSHKHFKHTNKKRAVWLQIARESGIKKKKLQAVFRILKEKRRDILRKRKQQDIPMTPYDKWLIKNTDFLKPFAVIASLSKTRDTDGAAAAEPTERRSLRARQTDGKATGAKRQRSMSSEALDNEVASITGPAERRSMRKRRIVRKATTKKRKRSSSSEPEIIIISDDDSSVEFVGPVPISDEQANETRRLIAVELDKIRKFSGMDRPDDVYASTINEVIARLPAQLVKDAKLMILQQIRDAA